ncbi:MAG: hypothetical protein GX661_02570 [Acholeplasmataceae bacterium]|nr:hypothetical protein [Acholeplasmataceae bacterium]
MSLKKIIIVGGIGTFLFLAGCQQASVNPIGQTDNTSNSPDQLVLGKKLENPYSVSSMIRARDSLVAQGVLSKSAVTDADLVATHYYIRFKPQNDTQLDELNKDSSLVLWDYPLDYEILEGGTVYRDPEIPANEPNYQYTAIEVGQLLPSVEYEILEELILEPEPESLFLEKKSVSNYYSILEQEALRITDNLSKNGQCLEKRMGKWRPTGNIQVFDDILGRNVPVVSVNVRTRNWFRWWDGYTDINGNFSCSKKYYGDLAYSLRWQYPNNRFDIRSGLTGQAFFNGPNQKRGAWNLVISSGMSWVYAHIFRAGSFYLGQEPFGLNNRPFDLISIQALNENSPSDKDAQYKGSNENIRIWKNRNDGTKNTAVDLFSNTAHELGHAHHDEIYDGSYVANVDDRKLKESWAVAIEYYMTSTVYGANSWDRITGSPFDVARQTWSSSCSFPNYTPIMVDLIDTHNQRVTRGVSTYLNDPVSGYTLKQFETIIAKKDCKKLSNFIGEIKKLPLPSGISATTRDNYLNQF